MGAIPFSAYFLVKFKQIKFKQIKYNKKNLEIRVLELVDSANLSFVGF